MRINLFYYDATYSLSNYDHKTFSKTVHCIQQNLSLFAGKLTIVGGMHGMQTRSNDENSVRPPVCQT